MIATDRPRFFDALAAVHALYRVEFSKPVGEIWWRAMEAYEIDAVLDALGRHAKNPDTGQFLPKPADVVKQLDGTTSDTALLAWAKVTQGLRRFGTYDSVAFDDPIIHRVLADLGGWVWLGRQPEKELQFVEKRFRDAYRAWRSRPALMDYPRSLPGVIEQTNGAAGFAGVNVTTKFIGDVTKAQAVLAGPASKAIELRVAVG